MSTFPALNVGGRQSQNIDLEEDDDSDVCYDNITMTIIIFIETC